VLCDVFVPRCGQVLPRSGMNKQSWCKSACNFRIRCPCTSQRNRAWPMHFLTRKGWIQNMARMSRQVWNNVFEETPSLSYNTSQCFTSTVPLLHRALSPLAHLLVLHSVFDDLRKNTVKIDSKVAQLSVWKRVVVMVVQLINDPAFFFFSTT